MILVDAIYIHQSGGKVLLELLIDTILQRDLKNSFFFLLDTRLETSLIKQLNDNRFKHVVASEKERKLYYKHLPADVGSVVCFANVPPPVSLADKKVYIFFHNSLLLESKGMNYKLITHLKFIIKRIYIRFKTKANYKWIVQTGEMQKQLIRKLDLDPKKISIIPFFLDGMPFRINNQLPLNAKKFLYVADGVDQKNHSGLLKAWKILSNSTAYKPELHLTIPGTFTKLLDQIKELNKNGVLIINHGLCTKSQLDDLYSQCNYLIFPSLAESFGLPLIEAASAGCEIISSDLPYVYEVVKPLMTFDPRNVSSMVEAIKMVIENPNKRGTEIRVDNQINSFIDLIKR